LLDDVGKRITVNYMMAKDSVKKRLSGDDGGGRLGFYQIYLPVIQRLRFYHLNKRIQLSIANGRAINGETLQQEQN
jgi:tyrosyl-tRNA synthetase